MWKFAVIFMCIGGCCLAGPVNLKRNMPIVQQKKDFALSAETELTTNTDANALNIMSSLSLPSNATSIRADITDGFSCDNKTYGYYADMDNDCQIFHVCLPVTYADGKENTFRWSFICPEETVFSQESFTCMRPDDMTISCQQSYQYYELNRIFGMVESSGEKEGNNEVGGEMAESNEAMWQTVEEPATAKPVVKEEKEQMNGQYKPGQKPSRRKPSVSFGAQKKPAISYPLRKIPQVTQQITETPAIKAVNDIKENMKPIKEEDIKPVVQKFSRRPVTASSNSNAAKEKIQNSKPDGVTATRTELFNQIRKRPLPFNKRPAEQLGEEPSGEQLKIETVPEQQNFSAVESNLPISNAETQMADSEGEASETNKVFVKPDKTIELSQQVEKVAEEPMHILEASEEIPAVIAETVETPKAEEEEEEAKNEGTVAVFNVEEVTGKPTLAGEPQIIEEVQSDEEGDAVEEIPQETQENSVSDENLKAVETHSTETDLNKIEIQNTNAVQGTQAEEESPELQQFLRTSAEQIENIDESKVADGVVQEAQATEEKPTDNVSVQAEREPAKEQDQAVEGNEEPEVTQTADELLMHEETKSAHEPKTPTEVQAADDIATSKESEAVEETHAAEEEKPISHVAEDSPIAQAEIAEKQADPEQTGAGDSSQEVNIVPSIEETQEIEVLPLTADEPTVEESKEKLAIPAIGAQTYVQEPLHVEEPKPIVHNTEETQPLQGVKSIEDPKSVEVEQVTDKTTFDTESVDFKSEAEPAIYEKDSEEKKEEALNVPTQTIEQMESEKPAEAPESMQATEEMSHPNALVQQMYEDMDANRQSIEAFKPVDPVMAHEAEQLIADFINTLRRNDFTNETPGRRVEPFMADVAEQAESHENIAAIGGTVMADNNENHQEKIQNTEDQEDNDAIQAEITEAQADTVEDNNEEAEEEIRMSSQDGESKQDSNISHLEVLDPLESPSSEHEKDTPKSEENFGGSINLPQEMYQIPVQVITTPGNEGMPIKAGQLQESVESGANTEGKVQEEETPAMSMAGYKPMSIDDIVELVKERLDHMPKNEMEKPMQLEQVLGEAQENKAAEDQVNEQMPIPAEEEPEINRSEEEIVMPIYQRTAQTLQADATIQTEDLKQDLNGDQTEVAEDLNEDKANTNRSYRSRSMLIQKLDPRKRHFLFKADSS